MSHESTKAFWEKALLSFLPHHGISPSGVLELLDDKPLTQQADRAALRILLSRASGIPWGMFPPYVYSKSQHARLR